MELTHATIIEASREDVLDYLLSREYDRALVEGIEAISAIEELELARPDEHVIARTMRYTAPTASRIPKFLKKYADKAPEHVHWRQRERWNRAERSMTYTIEAEIKPEWQQYYTTHGAVLLKSLSERRTELIASLTFEINVFGLKRLIERALRDEVATILTIQGDRVAERFAPQPSEAQ